MSSSSNNLQDSFFYGRVWNKDLVLFLVNFLVIERNEDRWVWNQPNIGCIAAAQQRINVVFSTNLTPANVHTSVRRLRDRWNTFNGILCMSGVVWDRASNTMSVPAEMWPTLKMVYYHMVDGGGCPYDVGDLTQQLENLYGRHNTFNWLLQQTGVVHDTISNRMFVPPEVRSKAERECGNAQMYFYYGDDRWEALKTIFRTDENTVFPGGPENPIVIESSVSSSSSVRPRRQFSNSIDQESVVSDINTWDDIARRMRDRRPGPTRGSSTQRSTAGSRRKD
ncbi:hypothetical protein ACS0TY_002948 [Phlomoides rotata]